MRIPGALLALALVGCGAAPGVHAEPRALVFTPAVDRQELRLVNPGPVEVPLAQIRLDPRTPDWAAFVVDQRELPRTIPAGGAVSLKLRADRKHFARLGRHGAARLLLVAGDTAQAVELRYQQPDLAADLRLGLLRSLGLLALLGGAAAVLRRRRAPLPPWPVWLPALAACALVPLGPGLCPTALAAPLSAADLDQCAAGRGGVPFALVSVGEGWLVFLVALVAAALGRLLRPTLAAAKLARRDLALAAAFAGPMLAFGAVDPRALALAQTGLPGLVAQPIAALVALAAIAASPRVGLERLGFAVAFAAIFLGGPALPGSWLAGTPHGLALLAGLGVLAAKIAVTAWIVKRLHAAPAGSRARTALDRLAPRLFPLAVVNLLGTSAWLLWR